MDDSLQIIIGDWLTEHAQIADKSINCCVTSPPYFGLRDYGHDDQIGQETTIDEYVEKLVATFRHVRRVLRDDGTIWLNLGDSYANDSKWGGRTGGKHVSALHGDTSIGRRKRTTGIGDKQLLLIPHRVALALQSDGWIVRQTIVWAKPNPMCEPVKDRCTSSHEYIFLLAKTGNYYFDADAIAEPSCAASNRPQRARAQELAEAAGLTAAHFAALRAVGVSDAGKAKATQTGFGKNSMEVQKLASEAKCALGGYSREFLINEKRNKRDVWTVPTGSYSGAHFATFPPDLIKPCILAGCPAGSVVLDPFAGSGTTGEVALKLNRRAILVELNPENLPLIKQRSRINLPLPI